MPTSPSLSSQPLISFIVTTYNLPVAMLKECLDSILTLSLSQSEREIIVVDDGSLQSPFDELEAYRDRIIYVRQPNQGVSMARNMGIHISTAQYIQFVDGDDYLIKTPYEHCLDIVRYKDPDIVLFDMTSQEGQQLDLQSEEPQDGAHYMRHNNLHASVCGYIFRRNLLLSLEFTKGVVYGEDEEFTPQLILRAELLYCTKAKAYFYRQHDQSMMHSKGKRSTVKRLSDNISVILHLRDIADTLPATERDALQRRVAQLSMDYLYNTIKATRSRKYLNKAIKQLRAHGLFPLPAKDYTKKYKYFRRMVNHPAGRYLLLIAIPLL